MSTATELDDLVASYLDLRWSIDPVAATAAGVTAYDDRLGAYAASDVDRFMAAVKSLSGALEYYSPDALADEIDRTAVLGDLRVTEHRFGRERPHVRNPGFWLGHVLEGLYLHLALADRSREHRARAAAARVRALPGFFDEARATLTGCPRVFVESALQMVEGGVALLAQVEQELAPEGDDGFPAACAVAGRALGDFAAHLERELLPGEGAAFALGEEEFNFRLHYEHALGNTAPELWRYGLHLVEETEERLEALGRTIDPSAAWPDLLSRLRGEHPSADALVSSYAAKMEAARRFVMQRGLAPVPDGTLHVGPTPPFLRPLIPFAAYQPPGAFSADRSGRFYVTPPDAEADPERVAELLRDHCAHDLASTALHEGYPGHHLQFLHAVTQPRLARKVIGSALTIEGWATYCEEMMGEEGFYETKEEQFFQLVALLWRAVRVVLDVGLHTRGMGFEEAVEQLSTRVHFDRAHAESEVRRYCAEPVYQVCYAVGRRELLALRDAYRDAAGAGFRLHDFHRDLLSYGGLPLGLARWGMGLDA